MFCPQFSIFLELRDRWYRFDFDYTLPRDLPLTFNDVNSSLSYQCSGLVIQPRSSLPMQTLSTPFTVLGNYYATNSEMTSLLQPCVQTAYVDSIMAEVHENRDEIFGEFDLAIGPEKEEERRANEGREEVKRREKGRKETCDGDVISAEMSDRWKSNGNNVSQTTTTTLAGSSGRATEALNDVTDDVVASRFSPEGGLLANRAIITMLIAQRLLLCGKPFNICVQAENLMQLQRCSAKVVLSHVSEVLLDPNLSKLFFKITFSFQNLILRANYAYHSNKQEFFLPSDSYVTKTNADVIAELWRGYVMDDKSIEINFKVPNHFLPSFPRMRRVRVTSSLAHLFSIPPMTTPTVERSYSLEVCRTFREFFF